MNQPNNTLPAILWFLAFICLAASAIIGFMVVSGAVVSEWTAVAILCFAGAFSFGEYADTMEHRG